MKKIFMLLASVALFGSCEDFLSKEDPNKIDAPSYFRNETDLQTYVNGFLQTMSPTAASVATGRRPYRLPGMARRIPVPHGQL